MTSRRSFFKKLLATAAAITVASAVECFGVSTKVVDAVKKAKRIIVNPAYVNAAYEDVVFFHPELKSLAALRCVTGTAMSSKKNVENLVIKDPRPERWNLEGGKWIQVPFYKEEEYEPGSHECHE